MAASPPRLSSTPLFSDASAVTVRVMQTSPAPPAVSASSSDADSSVSSPLHLAVLAVLYSVSVPLTRYFPPEMLFFASASRSSFFLCLPLAAATVISVTSTALLAAPIFRYLLPFRPWFSPLLLSSHLRHPLGSCVCPRRPAGFLPRLWPPISPVRTKMLVTVQAGVRKACQLRAKMPYGDCPSRLLAMVGDRIRFLLFLQCPQ